MGYLSVLSIWLSLCGASSVAPQECPPSPARIGSQSAYSLCWYTITPFGVLCDTAGPYVLSGCVSQSPISSDVLVDADSFCIIGGFWSSEFDARFAQEDRGKVLVSSLGPIVFKLHRNTPNPFRAATRIAYDLPSRTAVSLNIYDIDGRQVRQLADGVQNTGRYKLRWDRRDKLGRTCPAGVYFCSLKTEDNAAVEKMVIAE
ncbi:MAG TPA: T9SS type A sorting domain-containing protein [bacterium]|nr:T9SS type A sorting domain-containing protein [bacterium]